MDCENCREHKATVRLEVADKTSGTHVAYEGLCKICAIKIKKQNEVIREEKIVEQP